jgi:uroporphyrin-III C-methyltransferase
MSDQTTGPLDEKVDEKVDEKSEQAFDHIESRQDKATTSLKKSSGSGIGSVLAILLALVAIGIASWPAYEIYKENYTGAQVDPIPARVARIEVGLETLGNELRNAKRHMAAKNGEMNAQLTAGEEQMQQFQAGVSESLVAIQSRMGTSSQDWVYAEVEYLVRMANQRVLMEHDASSALQLLQSADEIIRETDGLTAHGLREALARDIAALKAVGSPDIQGVYLELSALVAQVPSLSRTLPTYQAPTPETDPRSDTESTLTRLLGMIQLAAGKLAHLVDFRRDEVEIKRILPPKEEYFLRQNLMLKLQIAQMALLEGNQKVFQSALGEAQVWVSDSFDGENPGTVAMLKSITRLSVSQVSVDLPDIAGSLKAARSQLAGFKEAQQK